MHIALSAISALALASFAHGKACPPLGAVLPAPQAPSENKNVQSAIKALKSGLDKELGASLNASGVSIAVKSIHEDELLFNYHYTPPVLSGIGTESIDENTVYRVGSISKMMPALVALQNDAIDTSASVLKYLPELGNQHGSNPINNVRWEDVTVGDLASHLAGLGTDTAQDLAIFPTGPWTDMGLPEVRNGTGPTCSGLPGTKPCTKDDLIDAVNRRQPVYLSQTSPVYSNIGFAILGLVIEAATGEKFEDVVKESIWDVAGMESTSFYGPIDSFEEVGFVPKGESTWNATLGVYEAAGGMFSNTIDLIAFSEAIYTNQLLSPAATRKWMKPDTHTSSFSQSIGAPWEILRTDNITSDKRLIDVYTKSGDLGLYHALMGIVPDYDFVITVISGGAEVSLNAYARTIIFSAVLKAITPAFEAAGKAEASSSDGFVGTYSDKSTNSSLTLKLGDGPGLLIDSFSVRGFDVLNNINSYSIAAAESGLSSDSKVSVEGRMYPTGISTKSGSSKNGSVETAWRAVFDSETEEQKAQLESQIFYQDASCETWFGLDRSAYNFLSLAEFVFVAGGDGAVEAVKNPAFDVTLTKVSDGNGTSNDGSAGGDGNGGGNGNGGDGSGDTPPASAASSLRAKGITLIAGIVLISAFFV